MTPALNRDILKLGIVDGIRNHETIQVPFSINSQGYTRSLRRRWVFGAKEWLSGCNGSLQNLKNTTLLNAITKYDTLDHEDFNWTKATKLI